MRRIEPFEQALLDYISGDKEAKFEIYYEEMGTVLVPVEAYLNDKYFPPMEQIALEECEGRILDAGAGTGRHSIWLQNRGLQVTAIDTCRTGVGVMKLRGLSDARCVDFFTIDGEIFDTIIMLNRGIGMCKKLEAFPGLLDQCRHLLSHSGRLIVDSVATPFPDSVKDDKGFSEPMMQINYKGIEGPRFQWLYLSYHTLERIAKNSGWNCEKIETSGIGFLCVLTIDKPYELTLNQ